MRPEIRFSAALLAGGQARRMGFDKALLPVGEQTLLHRQLQLLQGTGATELLLAGGGPERIWPLPGDINPQLVFDSHPDAGPLAGIAGALTASREDFLLVLAVDMPGMTPETLRQLLALARPGCGVVPVIDGRYEPVAAIYPREALVEIDARIRSGQRALQPCAAQGVAAGWLTAWPVPPDMVPCFANWNYPSDLGRTTNTEG